MDRDTRILYRQRGSNLRKTVDEDNVLVIRTPMKLVGNNTNNSLDNDQMGNISTLRKRSREDEPEFEPQIDIPYEQEQEPVLSPILNNHSYNNNNNGGRNEHRSKYQRITTTTNTITNFTKLSITNLIINETSIRCYDILKDLIQFLFKENLMRKAEIDINKYKNREAIQTMMYKLDYKIFEKIVIGIVKDLNDIKDINIANNILIHNLQRLQKRSNKLQMELINYRTQLTELMTNEDYWYQNKTDQINLQDRLKLNQDLKQLSNLVSTSNKEQQPSQQPDNNNNNTTNLQTVIELIDPQYGIINKINKINEKLRKQYI